MLAGQPYAYGSGNATTTTSSHAISIYAPVVAQTASNLSLPNNISTTSWTVYPSPATMHTETGGLDVPTSTKTHTTPGIAYSAHTERTRTQLDGPGATTSTSPPSGLRPHTENTGTGLEQPVTTSDGTTALVHTERSKTSLDMPGTTIAASAHTEIPGGPSLVGPTQGPTLAPSPVTAITQGSLQGPGSATALPQNNGDDSQPQNTADIGGIIASVLGGHFQGHNGGSGPSNAGPAPAGGAGASAGPPGQGPASPAQTYYAGASPIVAGSSPVVVAGTTYSLAPSGTAFFVNGQQSAVPEGVRPGPLPQQGADTNGNAGSRPQTYYISNTPVVAGSSGVVVAGTTYSLAPSGTAFYINGQQTAVPEGAEPASNGDSNNSNSAAGTYYISNTPIAAGSSGVAIGGTTYSLAATGTAFYVNGQQTSVPAIATPGSSVAGQAATETMSASASGSGSVAGSRATEGSSTSATGASSSQSAAPAQQTDSGASELLKPAVGLGAVGMLACFL